MNAAFDVLDHPSGRTLQPSGNWTVLLLDGTVATIGNEVHCVGQADRIDLGRPGRVDTSGAFVLLRSTSLPGDIL